jgi:sigma-B regulation protein RsbU (phosphoserine phosphatase)
MVEARNGAGEMFSEAALAAALAETARLTPDAAVDSIVGKVQRWAPLQDDDLTVLVCDYAGQK